VRRRFAPSPAPGASPYQNDPERADPFRLPTPVWFSIRSNHEIATKRLPSKESENRAGETVTSVACLRGGAAPFSIPRARSIENGRGGTPTGSGLRGGQAVARFLASRSDTASRKPVVVSHP